MPKLVVEKGVKRGQEYSLGQTTTLLSGRVEDADIPMSDSLASREHFSIEHHADGYLLTDLGSSNGTYINGKRVERALLNSGDRIQVGETVFSFVDESVQGVRGDLIGKTVAGYRIEERIGRGGMGTVYRATQLSLDRPVALKVLSHERVTDEQFRDMFLREARSAGKLNHPNIVAVFDVGHENDIYYYSMEYISGGNLLEQLGGDKRMDLDLALCAIRDAAQGLEYAEKMGIVHRDIKPDNIMLATDGTAKICDLGLAVEIDQPEDSVRRPVCGSPLYLSPEQARGKPVDARSDIYSLGATFYRLLAGTAPFSGKTIRDILDKHLSEKPEPVSVHNPDLPAEIEQIIMRMLEKDPGARYPTAASVIIALATFTAGHHTRFGVGFDDTAAMQSLQQRRLKRAAIAGISIAVLAIAALIGVVLTNHRPSPLALPPNPIHPATTPPVGSDDVIAQRILQRGTQLDKAKAFRDEHPLEWQATLDRFDAIRKALVADPPQVSRERYADGKSLITYARDQFEEYQGKIKDAFEVTQEFARENVAHGRYRQARVGFEEFLERYTILRLQAQDELNRLDTLEQKATQSLVNEATRLTDKMNYGSAFAVIDAQKIHYSEPFQKQITQFEEALRHDVFTKYVEIERKADRLVVENKIVLAIAEMQRVVDQFKLENYVTAARNNIKKLETLQQQQAVAYHSLQADYFALLHQVRLATRRLDITRARALLNESVRSGVWADTVFLETLHAEINSVNQLQLFKTTFLTGIETALLQDTTVPLRGQRVLGIKEETLTDEQGEPVRDPFGDPIRITTGLWIGTRDDAPQFGIPWSKLSLEETRKLLDKIGYSHNAETLHGFGLLCLVTGTTYDDFREGIDASRKAQRLIESGALPPKERRLLEPSVVQYPERAAQKIVARLEQLKAAGLESNPVAVDLRRFLLVELDQTEAARRYRLDSENE